MADKKISALPAATTPLAGSEVLPIVQGGVTDKVSVANLTAGRAISATELTLTTGNLVIGTSGKGIDFSATAGTGTSELLADYEEGTFTPTVYGGTTSGVTNYVSQVGYYTKIGQVVNFLIYLDWNGQTGSGTLNVGGLPFTSKQIFVQTAGSVTSSNLTFTANASLACAIQPGASNLTIAESTNNSGQNYVAVDTSAALYISGFYMV